MRCPFCSKEMAHMEPDQLADTLRVDLLSRLLLSTLIAYSPNAVSAAVLSASSRMDARDIRRSISILRAIVPTCGYEIKTIMGRRGGYSLTPISPEQREVA